MNSYSEKFYEVTSVVFRNDFWYYRDTGELNQGG